ncbi:MAG: type II 3-dehydroquinate dehydratase [Actinobacteria bacterium]|uniref:3-dehydroquinate dehydratase n=1 Tax=freshwater metagenome TaxID=449393 RepID=A0A6J5ZBX4_9ZZZZ|nr:type II 3-dehydroquinate dehydratase [Actinomycetota bacterium]
MLAHNRIAVISGVNLDQLGRRDPAIYGDLDYDRLTQRIGEFAKELELSTQFFQTNFEGELVEYLHRVHDIADAVVINPGAWTHYSYAIRDALEIADLPAVEVHLSDVMNREEFRRSSVIADVCIATVSGKGADGYREALTTLRDHLANTAA